MNKNNSNISCLGIIMSSLTETSLTSMKAAFLAALDPIQGIPKLASLIDLMLHMCRCLQTHKTPASDKMNTLFCAASPGLYSFFTTEAYPASFFPFQPEVDTVPDFSTCTSDNECETLKAMNAHDQKTRADIITMNAALSDVFLANLPKAIRKTYAPICMKRPNTVFLHMCDWFINKYGKMMTEDCEENRQKMAADWHPSDGFEPLATHLFVGASYASAARYPMNDHDVIDIGLHVIKRCGMYSKEYKNWIACKRKPWRLLRQSIPSRSTGPAQSRLSTRRLSWPHNMAMAWLPRMTTHCTHHTANRLQTLARPMLPCRKRSRPKRPTWLLCKAS
jgi:hypothetical protein